MYGISWNTTLPMLADLRYYAADTLLRLNRGGLQCHHNDRQRPYHSTAHHPVLRLVVNHATQPEVCTACVGKSCGRRNAIVREM